MSSQELEYRKRLQKAILLAGEEVLREQKDEVLARAIKFLKREERAQG